MKLGTNNHGPQELNPNIAFYTEIMQYHFNRPFSMLPISLHWTQQHKAAPLCVFRQQAKEPWEEQGEAEARQSHLVQAV